METIMLFLCGLFLVQCATANMTSHPHLVPSAVKEEDRAMAIGNTQIKFDESWMCGFRDIV